MVSINASIDLSPCKCGGEARFSFDSDTNGDRLLIECVECGIKSPYTTIQLSDEVLAHGKIVANVWNELQG